MSAADMPTRISPAKRGSPGVDAPPAWHAADAAAVAQDLGVRVERGLGPDEARSRLETYGPNRLAGAKKESGLHAFLRQYQDFMQIILLGAAVVNALVT